MKRIRILIVDDHSVVRLGMRSLLEKSDYFEVCGDAGDLMEAYSKVKELKPDVVLLDVKLPDGDGISGCYEIKKICPDCKIIILTAYAEEHIINEAIKSGADGYLLKTIDSKGIVSAILNVSKGGYAIDQSVTGSVFSILKKDKSNVDNILTEKEKSVLELISQGKTNKEIASSLYMAEKTVRNYVSSIMKKIDVSNRTEATIYWLRQKSLK